MTGTKTDLGRIDADDVESAMPGMNDIIQTALKVAINQRGGQLIIDDSSADDVEGLDLVVTMITGVNKTTNEKEAFITFTLKSDETEEDDDEDFELS